MQLYWNKMTQMKLNKDLVFFTGGGTGGHIYPGLAVADELKTIAETNNQHLQICWIGCSKGMDRNIVEKATGPDGKASVNRFYGIPSGKLRRYFSLKNFSDLFRIAAGFFAAYHILRKAKPEGTPDYSLLCDDESRALIAALGAFPEAVREAAEKYEPYLISRAVMQICQTFNRFYYEQRIMTEDAALRNARLTLTEAARDVIAIGFNLIGLSAPERM